MRKYTFTSKAATIKIEKILNYIKDKPASIPILSNEIHIVQRHCLTYINYLLQQKQVYISKWIREKTKRNEIMVPYYRAGSRKSAVRPPALTSAEKHRLYRKRRKADKDYIDLANEKRRLRRAKQKIQPKSDWTFDWIKQSSSSSHKSLTLE